MSHHHSQELRQLSREQLIAQLEAELEGVARTCFARRIAPEFIRTYSLFPYGVNPIPWLTRSRCRTNAEALVDWIERQLGDVGFLEGSRESPKSIVLDCRLQKLLATVEAAHPWWVRRWGWSTRSPRRPTRPDVASTCSLNVQNGKATAGSRGSS